VQALHAPIKLNRQILMSLTICDAGLCSIEVDCFAVGKECLVGHNQGDLQAHHTLQAGFLATLLT
jgi:hypothetical protein